MNRLVYVNGEYLPEEAARISVFDRGFLMGDAVYEVTAVLDGKLLDFASHMTRLERSLAELQIPNPSGPAHLLPIHRELLRRNRVTEGMVYLQVTRGVADRDFVWPDDVPPTLVLFTQKKSIRETPQSRAGIKVISLPDIRWQRRDIKTVQLVAASWARMQAKAAGADDAWFVENGLVTEGTSNNAWIITHDRRIVTRDLSQSILHGITRATLLNHLRSRGFIIEERAFSIAEAQGAAEAFYTAASAFVCPVVQIDGVTLGDGKPGPVTRQLRELFIGECLKAAI